MNKIVALSATMVASICAMLADTWQRSGVLGKLGVSQDMFATLTQDTLWLLDDRTTIVRCMQALRDGVADLQGYQPFAVPAEYQAALICYLISPCNYHSACAWLAGSSVPASELAAGEAGSSEPVRASQLFSLVMMARADCPHFKNVHDSRMNKEANRAKNRPPQQLNA